MSDKIDRPLRILHVISGLWKHTGGPAASVPGLCDALVGKGCEVTLATLDGPMSGRIRASRSNGVDVKLFRPSFRHSIWYSSHLARELPCLVQEADIIHVHGLWEYPAWLACRLAGSFRKALVMTPHGTLDPEALKISRWKKKLSAGLFDNRNLRSASCLHATSDAEARGFDSYGLSGKPIAVIPNGVDLSDTDDVTGQKKAHARFGACRNKRVLLCMSRLDPIKGLIDLAEAWGGLAFQYPDWHLLIMGPDERGHFSKVMKVLDRHKVLSRVTYGGVANEGERASIFAASELFVLPTHSESFGMAIAEALWMGLPVISTQGAPWQGLQHHNCGWWVPTGKDGLVSALRRSLCLSREDLAEMGLRGKKWVRETFTWGNAGREMVAVYRWLLSGGRQPGCIRTREEQ